MIAELGHFSLILALIAGLIQGFLPLAGTALGVRSWVNVARPAVFANAVFCTFAFCCLAWCFYTSDFSVMNVANNSNSMLPVIPPVCRPLGALMKAPFFSGHCCWLFGA